MNCLHISKCLYHGNNRRSDPEQQKVAEVAQQTLTDFVQTLVRRCLHTMEERLKREVCATSNADLKFDG